ncbi:hypothetical protein JK358_35595 [Nocardia sp. 2]|uniref:DUF397 domain-containing protein n=1 Tax=Nocardia acididurans TaxID=2802282 RepID=A0ABS1MGN3_9NOCA|nr:hypothetical protein [Nocardia acididurans]
MVFTTSEWSVFIERVRKRRVHPSLPEGVEQRGWCAPAGEHDGQVIAVTDPLNGDPIPLRFVPSQ